MLFVFVSCPYGPVPAGNVQYRRVFTPHGFKIVRHVFGCTVVVEQSLVVYPRHGLLSGSHIEVYEIPISASADIFCTFDERQVVFYVRLLVFYAEVEGFRVPGMKAAVGTCSPFANDGGAFRVTRVLVFHPSVKVV